MSLMIAGFNPSILTVPIAYADPLTIPQLQAIASSSAEHYNLTPRQTRQMFATVSCESNWDIYATSSTDDFGISQINANAHPDISLSEMDDPYFSLDYIAKEFSLGNERMWTCWRLKYQ